MMRYLSLFSGLHRSTIRRALPVPGVQRVGTVLTKGRPWIAYGVVA